MRYGSERTKFTYGATLAASLAFLILRQRDSVGLSIFDEGLVHQISPSNSRAQLGTIVHALSEAKPDGKTKIGQVLHEVAERLVRKGLVILISDFFDDPDAIGSGVRHLRHCGHDVLLFHVMDRDEVDFPFQRMTLFEGLEAMPRLLVDPKSLREAYLREVAEHEAAIRKVCLALKVDYQRIVTDEFLDVALSTYLAKRGAMTRATAR